MPLPSPDTYIQKTKKSYIDSRARRNLGSINTELQDVQRIMVANIEEVLQRGEALSGRCTLPRVKPMQCVFLNNSEKEILLRFIDSVLICVSPSSVSPLSSFLFCFGLPLPFLRFLLPAALDSKASNLSSLSKKYRSDAKYLNTRSTYAKLAAGGVFFIMLIVYVRFWWL